MDKIFLINYLGNYAFCFQEDKEKAEEDFISLNWLREFFYTKKREEIKKELETIELKEGKHYLTKYKNYVGIEVTLKNADDLPIVICKKYPRNPLELDITEEDKRKIINVIEKIIQNS